MNLRLVIGFLATSSAAFPAGLELDGPGFAAPAIKIVWNAPTNHWPTNLWIYKVLPQQFAPTVVSNLMAIGGFSAKDRTNIQGQPPFKDKGLSYFANKERTRHLGIFPPLGWLYYRDERAAALGQTRAKGVPTEADAIELARKYMDMLAIDRSQLVTKDGSTNLLAFGNLEERNWIDKRTGEQVREVIVRGVSFVRRIDGIGMTGRGSDGGFGIRFASEAKVAGMELLWRNLQRHESRKSLAPAQVMERIQQGQAKMVPMAAIDPSKAKELTIKKVVPYYLGESGDSPQAFVFPFAALECEVETDNGGSVGVVLKCPILEGP